MVLPKSDVWKYFTKINKNEAKCNVCAKTLKTCGNTSNLKCHLKVHKLKDDIGRSPTTDKPSCSKSVKCVPKGLPGITNKLDFSSSEKQLAKDVQQESHIEPGPSSSGLSSTNITTHQPLIKQRFSDIKSFTGW